MTELGRIDCHLIQLSLAVFTACRSLPSTFYPCQMHRDGKPVHDHGTWVHNNCLRIKLRSLRMITCIATPFHDQHASYTVPRPQNRSPVHTRTLFSFPAVSPDDCAAGYESA